MAKIVIYGTNRNEQQTMSPLGEDNDLIFIDDHLTAETLVADAEVVSTFISSTISRDLIEAMPNLKLIACRSTGFNNVDMDAAKERGISVVNVPTYGEHTVAEFTFGLILALTRKVAQCVAQAKDGQIDGALTHGTDLFGKTLGVYGYGRIGRHVAEVGRAFGMRVIAHDPCMDSEYAQKAGVEAVDMDTLLASADILSVHAPLTEDNAHTFDAEVISKMKQDSYFVNTARGELAVTADLIAALQSGHLAGAAVDVLEGEQLLDVHEEELLIARGQASRDMLHQAVANNLLIKQPNAIVTCHMAYNTKEAIERINTTTLTNIESFLSGKVENEVSAP